MTDEPTAPPHVCGGCLSRWGGANTAHCAGCHHTFTGVTAFTRHRTGRGEHGQCHHPATAGLVDAERGYPCWAMPGTRPDRDDDQ